MLARHEDFVDRALGLACDSPVHRAAIAVALAPRDIQKALNIANSLEVFIEDAGGERLGVTREHVRTRILTAFVAADPLNAEPAWDLAGQLLGQKWDYAEGLMLAGALARASATRGLSALSRLEHMSWVPTRTLAAAYIGYLGGPSLLNDLSAIVPTSRWREDGSRSNKI